ncbi:MAG TPA: hypothetical protein ENF40_00595, partial [Thermoplasmatales archaeon]|nr:hypothetical protein [Thermoplasmatales archaeon]
MRLEKERRVNADELWSKLHEEEKEDLRKIARAALRREYKKSLYYNSNGAIEEKAKLLLLSKKDTESGILKELKNIGVKNPETVVRVRETIGTDEILGEKPVYYPDARTSFKDVYYMLPGAEKFIFASDLYANELMFGISAAGLEKDLNKGIIPEELMNKFETERLKLLEPSIRKGKEGIWQIIDGDTIYVIEKEGEELKIYRNMGLKFIKRSIRDDLGGEVTSIDAMGLKNGGIGSIRFRDKEGKEKEIIFHGKNAKDVELKEDISVYSGKLRGRDSLTDPEFFERNFKRIVIGGYVLMDTDQLPQNLDPKIVGFERIEELEDPRYGHAGLHAYRKVGEVRNLAVIMKIDQYISEMEIEKEEIYGIKDITEFYKNQFRKIKKKVDELPWDQKIIITNALRGMGFSEKAKNKEKLKDAFGEVFDVLTLTDDEVREYCVRGNPVIIRLPEDKAKEFKVDTKEYVKEPSKKEVEKFIDNLCKKHPDLDREYLRDMYIDLETKLKQYIASNDAYIDRKARFIQNKLNPEGVIVWVEGMGWCELRETDEEFVLRRIKKDEIPEFPAHVVLTDEVLDGEILPIVESVTGIEDERLLEDWKRIKAASPMDVVEYEYDLKKGTAIPHSKLGKSAISPSLGDVSLVGTPIHEITHLEDIRYRSGIGIIDFYLGKLLGRLSPRGYREGVAVLAKKNGCNRLADMRKDIAIQVLGNHHGALMVATRIAEYLEEKGLDQKEIIDSLEEMGVSHYLMLDILGDGWKYGEIDSKLFKKTRKYYARAYEIAKYFGEDVQVLKISRDKWKEFLKARKDWRKLHRHELKTEFLDYDLYEMGGEPGLGFSTMQWLQLLEKKRGMLEWEKELLKSKKRSVREKVKKVLKDRGMSVDDRLRAIEEELSEVEEKTRKILEGDWEDIEFEDVVWRIREPKELKETPTTDPAETKTRGQAGYFMSEEKPVPNKTTKNP